MANSPPRKTSTGFIFPDGIEVVVAPLVSQPPSGKLKITNIYVDPVTEKVVVEYEDTPVE